jgi:uncharacterized Zn finger protein (UPF0148 family)
MENENISNPEEGGISIEKKLGDLMLRGWTMLADTCPSECKRRL